MEYGKPVLTRADSTHSKRFSRSRSPRQTVLKCAHAYRRKTRRVFILISEPHLAPRHIDAYRESRLSPTRRREEPFFHCVEKTAKVFPLRGKNGPVFPQCGKYFSIAWKNREKVFHTVENFMAHDHPTAAISRKIRLRHLFVRKNNPRVRHGDLAAILPKC